MNLDKLNEISRAAAVAASSALSKMIQKPVGIDILPAKMFTEEEPVALDSPNGLMVGLTMPLSGDLTGVSLCVFSKEAALLLCDLLMQRKEQETQELKEIEISALTEVANIIVGNFLTPFAHPLKLSSLMHHVPKYKCDTYQNMIDHINTSVNMNSNEKLLVEIVIGIQHKKVKGFLIFILGVQKMKEALGT